MTRPHAVFRVRSAPGITAAQVQSLAAAAVAAALAGFEPPSGGGAVVVAPLVVPAGETFVVPANVQVLYRVPIQVDGELVIEGELIEV